MSYQEKLELVKDFVNKQKQEQERNKKYKLELCKQISDSVELFIIDDESLGITLRNNLGKEWFIRIYPIHRYGRSYFTYNGKTTRFIDADIPTLEDILKYVKSEELLDMYIKENNIEVKSNV